MVPTPTDLTLVSAVAGEVIFEFTGAIDVDHYDIYRSTDKAIFGIQINTIGIPEPSPPYNAQFSDDGISSINAPSGPATYYYKVVAVDVDGNPSLPSDALVVPIGVNQKPTLTPEKVQLRSVEVRGN